MFTFFIHANSKVKKTLAFCLFFLIITLATAQKQNNVWVFSKNAGLDFNTIPPKALDSVPLGTDTVHSIYTSSICDTGGKLLLYTDGITVWSRFKFPLERYLGRWPWAGYAIPLVVPHPENDSLFYIFGVSSEGSYAYRLQYLSVNIKSTFGYGNIVYPQPSTLTNYFTVLKENASILLAGTAHCNKRDTWIVTHSQNAFYTYLVTANGVSSVPVVSPVGADIVPEVMHEHGNIKFSASGEKMIMPLYSTDEVAVFEFNNLTGTFSNGFKLKVPEGLILEDAELSPDGSKLYFGAYSIQSLGDYDEVELHSIQQWNLDAGNLSQIQASLYNITPFPDRASCSPHICYFINRTLQLGPDGKIYVSMRRAIGNGVQLDKTASVIDAPNEAGAQAFYKYSAANIRRVYSYIDYNYLKSSSYTIKENGIQFKKSTCSDQPVTFSLLINRVDSVLWDFGDSASGTHNYSQLLRPVHIYPASGIYYAKAIIYYKCATDTAYAQVTISKDKSVHIPARIKDTVICTGSHLSMDATSPGATNYVWGGGNTKPVQEITVSGTYDIRAMNNCSADERLFTVQFQKCDCNIYVPTAFTPNGDGLNDYFKPVVKCFPGEFRFVIYNRYGNMVYQTSDTQAKGWNGKIKSWDAATENYLWTLFYKDPNGNEIKTVKGTVTLIR